MLEFRYDPRTGVLEIQESTFGANKTIIKWWYYDVLSWKMSSLGKKGDKLDRDMDAGSIDWTVRHHMQKVPELLHWKLPDLPMKAIEGRFHHLHRCVVVAQSTDTAVEGHCSGYEAKAAADALNRHNEENGHAERFVVRAIPEKWHDFGPSHWH